MTQNCEPDTIRDNILRIKRNIETAAVKSGRKPEDIKLIAVTKTIESSAIEKAIDYGITCIGENKVQELCQKYENIQKSCEWHFIGHLQTNKVKYILDKVSLIHSLDSISLANEIQKRAEKAGKVVETLIQVNAAREKTKFGIDPDEVLPFLKHISVYKNIKVKGLMTIAPLVENPEEVRGVFRGLRKMVIDISRENIDNIDMDLLSMGMTKDYEVAIEEGSNIVRIGTGIFGKRQY